MRSIALLANLESGTGGAEDAAALLRELGATVSEFALDDVGRALASAPDRLAVASGDGTLAGVAAAAGRAGLELAVIPTGTANDFARQFGIPREIGAACEVAATGERVRRLDLAWMDGRPFLNVASLGLPPEAAARATDIKGVLGPIAYAIGALGAGLRARPVGSVVRCDGEELYAGEAWQVTIGCSGAFGAGSSVEADPADGKLDVVVIAASSRARLALHAYAMRTGGLAEQAGVHKERCASAEIDLQATAPFNVDGELVESGSCRFTVEQGAVAVVVG